MYHSFYNVGPHIAVFLGLITLGFGYWICLQAKTDTHCPKYGKFIGVLISLVAALGIACVLYLTIKRCCLANKGESWHQSHMQMVMPGETPKETKK